MICPYETAENAKLAKNKVSRLMRECSRVGRKETKWIIAETVTRAFVSFGAAYCTYCANLLIGNSGVEAILGAALVFLCGIFLSVRIPLMTDTSHIVYYVRLVYVMKLITSIAEALDTISSIQSENPALISSESGSEARLMKDSNGDMVIETESHRYVFPMASDYTKMSDVDGIATVDFKTADNIIDEIKKAPLVFPRH